MGRILIVDEENISVKGIKYLLESKLSNTSYYVCKTCSSALNELRTNEYALIILDMMLPIGDWKIITDRADNLYGINLLEELRKFDKKMPVVCYTVVNDITIKEKIHKLHSYYIWKLQNNSREELMRYIKKFLK